MTARAERTVLILSSGRTATMFLARYFDANYDGVVARHEPPPSRLIRMASHARLAGHLSDGGLRSVLAWKRRREERGDGALYIEANPYLAGCADLLGEIWDRPTFIHIVRDPREQTRSAMRHGMSTGVKGFLNQHLPYWYPDVRKIFSLDHKPDWLEMAAYMWTLFNSFIRQAAHQGHDYHLLLFEELFDESFSGLRRLCGILGLDFREDDAAISPRELINPGRRDVLLPWPDWTSEQCRTLHRICSPLMGDFGYGLEPEWILRVNSGG